MNFKIGSLNVRGMRDIKKRRELFSWLKKKKLSIIFLQETHSDQDSCIQWEKECGYTAIFSHATTHSSGVCIFFNNNLDFSVKKCYVDPQGRFIVIDILSNETYYTLINVYAPNNECPMFFNILKEKIDSFNCENIIFGGDFNCVINPILDKTRWSSGK